MWEKTTHPGGAMGMKRISIALAVAGGLWFAAGAVSAAPCLIVT
jgi:hypothetical protein